MRLVSKVVSLNTHQELVGGLSDNTISVYKLGLFNIDMFTHVVTTGSFTLKAGEALTGGTSGAGIIEAIHGCWFIYSFKCSSAFVGQS